MIFAIIYQQRPVYVVEALFDFPLRHILLVSELVKHRL